MPPLARMANEWADEKSNLQWNVGPCKEQNHVESDDNGL